MNISHGFTPKKMFGVWVKDKGRLRFVRFKLALNCRVRHRFGGYNVRYYHHKLDFADEYLLRERK